MNAALLIASARRVARASALRAAVASVSAPSLSHALSAGPVASSSLAVAPRGLSAAMAPSLRAFSTTTKKPKVAGDSSDSDSDRESDDENDSDDEENDSDSDDDEEEEERELNGSYGLDDDWDEERWGALDSEDWQGFDGDLDAVTEEGVPKWLQSVRDLSAIHQEKRMRDKLARRAMEEAKKNVVRVRKVDDFGRAYGTGRRKTSSARVWVKRSEKPFEGRIRVNKMDLVDYFVRDTHREDVLKPFSVIDQIGNFDVYCTVKGGGLSGQAGAVRHGISRALQNFDPNFRPLLKKEKLLTRDPRMVERKKAGQKKARKKFQWVKR
ncbi:hypothetical protein ATCC90586_000339 [Pythium insidiosum]|nr:hypothetical protein ATCC90586_000339 [Pythium insidiosum]